MSDAFREAVILGIRAEIEALVSEREQMIAANQYRQMRGETIAYDEKAFVDNASLMRSAVGDPHRFE